MSSVSKLSNVSKVLRSMNEVSRFHASNSSEIRVS